MNNNSLRMIITFVNKSGNKICVNVSQNDTVNKLLNLFLLKYGISSKGIIFIYDEKRLNLNDHRRLFEVIKKNREIVVLDLNNVEGA